jgi:hypothetical protein
MYSVGIEPPLTELTKSKPSPAPARCRCRRRRTGPEPPVWRHEAALDLLGLALDGLPVGDLRAADVGVDLELAQHAVDRDLEVQLAHAGDLGLAGLLVGADLEGGVLLGELLQRRAHLLLVGLGLGLDGDGDDRLGNVIVSS